ncbi:MAG: hypothetical protein A2284_16050 [Deltaproteobacteria bacterium RIFOXYA12_FULL_61_11]|nr:MAG: hypothetical protein A2284_16050 [Deltaproteobacteria bacterium RIFOXYA12_FULL_61_11]
MNHEPLILGICNTSDSGAALLRGNDILGAVGEERLNRVKLTREFPVRAITWLLKEAGCTAVDLDHIACGAWAGLDPTLGPPLLVESLLAHLSSSKVTQKSKVFLERTAASCRTDAIQRQAFLTGLQQYGLPLERVGFYDHHLAHALTAYCGSPFRECWILTSDLRGDHRSTTLWAAGPDQGLRLLHQVTEWDSVGAFYAIITALLGFTPDRHEGKVMGLAAHGNPARCRSVMKEMIELREGTFHAQLGPLYKPFVQPDVPKLRSRLAHSSCEDIAASAQEHLERLLLGYLRYHHRRHSPGRPIALAVAGGVFANIRLNARLAALDFVEDLFVFPNMGDGGCALGGALAARYHRSHQNLEALPKGLPHVYLGPAYDDVDFEKALHGTGLEVTMLDSPSRTVATCLAAGLIVGWFQGRTEYGPRALGNRSILAPAISTLYHEELNRRLHRDDFMPFAPVLIEEVASRCFKDYKASSRTHEFMTTLYTATKWFTEKCPAAVHVDGTARPQVVRRDVNPLYHEILDNYFRMTGIPAVINTSFNTHEEPIVCSPSNAVHCFQSGAAELLVLGNRLCYDQAFAGTVASLLGDRNP